MYTRCPECGTLFTLTVEQLKARDGLVRCGRCDAVFRADQHLLALPAWRRSRPGLAEPAQTDEPLADTETVEITHVRATQEIPVVSELSFFQPRRRRVPTGVWATGVLLLLITLVAQFAFFYRDELAQHPDLRPVLAELCDRVGCELAVEAQAVPPEIVQTAIAPHPRYTNALRLRAVFANRTATPQPLPLMEVTLTDNAGAVLARRTFRAAEYLEDAAQAEAPMPPDGVYGARLDLTNPDARASGYEVQLLPP